jgi:hypothetical protein
MRIEGQDRPVDVPPTREPPPAREPVRWSVPQSAMLVVGLSAGLWLLIGATAHWLLS